MQVNFVQSFWETSRKNIAPLLMPTDVINCVDIKTDLYADFNLLSAKFVAHHHRKFVRVVGVPQIVL